MFEVDYFKDDTTHVTKAFWWCFQMNKDTFLKIVQGVWEYDSCFLGKKDFTDLVRNVWLPWGVLRMEHLQMPMMIIYAWLSPRILRPCTDFAGRWWQCLAALSEGTQWRRHKSNIGTKYCEKISRYAWKHQLHALELEELSVQLARDVQWSNGRVQSGAWRYGRLWSVNLICFSYINVLWHLPIFGTPLVEGHVPAINYEINGHTYIKRILSSWLHLSFIHDIWENNLPSFYGEDSLILTVQGSL
jgi:hypothetical protein